MSILFTADQHWGHKNIIKHTRRPFGSLREMDETLIERWNARVKKQDTVYVIGDMVYGPPKTMRPILDRLHGTIHLLIGDHDDTAQRPACRDRFASISPLLFVDVPDKDAPKGQRLIVLCHWAFRVWRKRHWGSWHLYGHSHGKLPEEPKSLSFDVGVDAWDFYPVSYEEVAAKMARKNVPPRKARFQKRNPDPNIWTAKDGTETPVPKLSDDHLRNVLRWVYQQDVEKFRKGFQKEAKWYDAQAEVSYGSMGKDPAGLADAENADHYRAKAELPDNEVLAIVYPQLPTLEFEARRRKLA